MVDLGYARVSTLDQDLTIQLDALERAGCWPIHQEKVSGVAQQRPVRDEILRQLQADDTLTTTKLDRLGRSVVEVLKIIEDLDQRGVRYRCTDQAIDTGSASGRLQLQLLAAFAEFERSMILERTAAGKARRAAEGKHPGGTRLYGFEADHETIREHEAAVIREAARRLLAGESASSIVEDWTARGIPTRDDGRWQVTTLRNILRNPRMVPILGQDQDRVLRLFGTPGRQRQGRPAIHLLGGILRCTCGQAMYVAITVKSPTNTQTVYRCQKAKGSGGRSLGCGRTYVSERAADRWAEEAFIAAILAPEFAAALNQRHQELLAGEATAQDLDDWREEMHDLETVPARYAPPNAQQRHAELRRMVDAATSRLMMQPELQALLDLPRSEVKLRGRWMAWTMTERRQWLRRVLDRVIVHPATSHGRGSDVTKRMEPRWRI